ncbi:MAG: BsuBI/PstI family type II restriction endonuclease [Candidatus Peregrinibacteria bacterium]
MPSVSHKFRRQLDEIRALLSALGFTTKHNTDLTSWAILALQDEKKRDTKAGFGSLASGATIRDILDYCRKCGTGYAENTRESLRKHSVKYLVHAGMVISNPDDPSRPTNSAKTNYILHPEFQAILKSGGAQRKTLIEQWQKHAKQTKPTEWRRDKSLSVRLNGKRFKIHPSKHNLLEKFAIEVFLPALCGKFDVLYFSDTDDKSLHVDKRLESYLETKFDVHKKIPDIVVSSNDRRTLFFIEAVASSGEVDYLRKDEIDRVFPLQKGIRRRYVSMFMNRKDFRKFSDSIALGTEAWIVEESPHVIDLSPL